MDKNDFFNNTIQAMIKAGKDKDFADKPIRTLGEVILLLKMQPQENIVKIDFLRESIDLNPEGVDSYRGYYEDLSLDYQIESTEKTVKELLVIFENAIGKTFQGYKGGDFTMNSKTLVWVAQYGSCGRMLIDIQSKDGITLIITKDDEDDKV
jgi:hypothetical protein